MKLAFLGLGVMISMAGHLQTKGHSVTVYNRTTAKAEAWPSNYGGAFSADTSRALWPAPKMVMMCVGNDNDLMEVGQIALAACRADFRSWSTASADAAHVASTNGGRKASASSRSRIRRQGGRFNGQLTVMCGGDQATFDKAKPVIDCYAKATTLLGASGAGAIDQNGQPDLHRRAGQALSEGLAFAEKAGLDKSSAR